MKRLVGAFSVILFVMLVPNVYRTYSASDSLYSYLKLNNPVTHSVIHLNRLKASNGNYTNNWHPSTSDQRYSFYIDNRGYETYQRQQITGLPPNGKYFEKYIWDSQKIWLYSDYISLEGDIFNYEDCNPKCDYVVPAGQKWLKNVTASSSQGSDTSPAILQWDASTTGPGRGDYYYAEDELHGIQHHTYCGQIWKRSNWNLQKYRSYPDTVGNAEAIGWHDPGTSSMSEITLAPKDVYILRQYSGCESGSNVCSAPWYKCEIFEDYVYGKDANGNKLGQVLFVAGFTPKHDNWYQTVGDYYAVYHVMISK